MSPRITSAPVSSTGSAVTFAPPPAAADLWEEVGRSADSWAWLSHALRSVMREEMGSLLAEGGQMRCTVRSEVEAALQSWGAPAPQRTSSRALIPAGKETKGGLEEVPQEWSNKRAPSKFSAEGECPDHFAEIAKAANVELVHDDDDDGLCSGTASTPALVPRRMLRVVKLWEQFQNLEEPPHTGRFARFITGSVFDSMVTVVIIINTVWMGYVADAEIKDPDHDLALEAIGDVVFQAFYTTEMVLKLSVYRQWFFCNSSWKLNLFELSLVIAGFVSLSTSISSVTALRVLRVLSILRATRAVQAMAHLRHLRALIACIQGSMSSLIWSLVTVVLVYFLFSLFMVQIITSHLIETGEAVEDTVFYDSFGSIAKSILTLHKASTGGDDWSQAYNVLQNTGVVGSALYLFFIVFMNFAVMNIITGIFVESAMLVLKPDAVTIAQETSRQEQRDTQKLYRLCIAVDADQSGKLTRGQFEDGLRKKHIPMLLKSLGLQRHHLVEFFNHMAEVQDDDGQVDILTFVDGCMMLRGVATNFDLQKLHANLQKLHAEFKACQNQQDQHLNTISKTLSDRLEE